MADTPKRDEDRDDNRFEIPSRREKAWGEKRNDDDDNNVEEMMTTRKCPVHNVYYPRNGSCPQC
jgi:hypothetical protein